MFCVVASVLSRSAEIFVPDSGLEGAIREALHKPGGALTEDDLLGLTELDASQRNIRALAGLETARNLSSLLLRSINSAT